MTDGVGVKPYKSDHECQEELQMAEIVARVRERDQLLIDQLSEFIDDLKGKAEEDAKREALEALIRTGVTTKDGKLKESIVSWE